MGGRRGGGSHNQIMKSYQRMFVTAVKFHLALKRLSVWETMPPSWPQFKSLQKKLQHCKKNEGTRNKWQDASLSQQLGRWMNAKNGCWISACSRNSGMMMNPLIRWGCQLGFCGISLNNAPWIHLKIKIAGPNLCLCFHKRAEQLQILVILAHTCFLLFQKSTI